MSRPTFTLLNQDTRTNGCIYSVLADSATGFDDFLAKWGEKMLPGTTIDIADYRKVFRLRNDGSWEEYSSYLAAGVDPEAAEAEAVAAVLDELIPDSAIEGMAVDTPADDTGSTDEGTTDAGESEGVTV